VLIVTKTLGYEISLPVAYFNTPDFKTVRFRFVFFFLMYFCILIFPFLSFLSCTLFGRFIGVSGSCYLSTAAIASSFFLSLFTLYETAILGSNCTIFFAP
jgi:hypothetical protein